MRLPKRVRHHQHQQCLSKTPGCSRLIAQRFPGNERLKVDGRRVVLSAFQRHYSDALRANTLQYSVLIGEFVCVSLGKETSYVPTTRHPRPAQDENSVVINSSNIEEQNTPDRPRMYYVQCVHRFWCEYTHRVRKHIAKV